MAQRNITARGQEILARWCVIAEQRLDYLTGLYESGRWRRFYSEDAFLENIREAKVAVETWYALARREAALDNTTINRSWLGRTESSSISSISFQQDRPHRPRLLQLAEVTDQDEPASKIMPETGRAQAIHIEIATSAAETSDQESATSAIHERYPLLHNAL
jgi:uncharacterized repeat protein (TIGR03809 family)